MFSKEKSLQVKGLAILLLVFHHLFYNAGRVQASGMKFYLVPYFYVQIVGLCARICVWIFVFISAYGLAAKYSGCKKNFIRNSWLSLMSSFWIPYIMVLLIYGIAKQGSAFAHVYKNNWKYLILDFLGWSDFFSTPMLMGVWWYMCFAQMLVFLIPMITWVYKKGKGRGMFLLLFAVLFFLPWGITSQYGGRYSSYLFAAVFGVWCQQTGALNRLLEKRKERQEKWENIWESILLFGMILALLGLKYILPKGEWQINSFISGMAAMLICAWFAGLSEHPVFVKPFQFLGRHSGNMFMVHSAIYGWFPAIVYWSRLPLISWGTVVVVSLLFSIVIEKIKKIIGYRDFIGKISKRLDIFSGTKKRKVF